MTGEERLDRFEQAVTQEFARANQQFAQMDQRFAEVDRRFDQVDQRFERVEARLDGLDTKIDRVHTSLRVLIEHNTSQIAKLAEAVWAWGRRQDEMAVTLRDLKDFVFRTGTNHEVRIQRLEEHTGLTPGRTQE